MMQIFLGKMLLMFNIASLLLEETRLVVYKMKPTAANALASLPSLSGLKKASSMGNFLKNRAARLPSNPMILQVDARFGPSGEMT